MMKSALGAAPSGAAVTTGDTITIGISISLAGATGIDFNGGTPLRLPRS
jgi:hypothetical protein